MVPVNILASSQGGMDLIPKWRPINYSFVCMLISPLCLVSMYKTQKNFEVKKEAKRANKQNNLLAAILE